MSGQPHRRQEPRLTEVREYHIAPDREAEFWQRFENVTLQLFRRLGFTLGPSWVDNDDEHVFTYLLYWSNEEAMLRAWDSFGQQPEWLASKDSEGDRPYLTASGRRLGKRWASEFER